MAFLYIIILTDSVFALRINEIESNPSGKDSGAEWVELYSEDTISLEDYYLENGDGGVYNLSGSFSGFFVIIFEKLWLDNLNETVYLKLNGQLIDSVGPFNDGKNNDESYNFCEGKWVFVASTKNAVNKCVTNSNSKKNNTNENNKKQVADNNKDEKIIINNSGDDIVIRNIGYSDDTENKKIILNSNPEKNNLNSEVTRTYKTRIGVIYFFIGFCVLLVILIALRKL